MTLVGDSIVGGDRPDLQRTTETAVRANDGVGAVALRPEGMSLLLAVTLLLLLAHRAHRRRSEPTAVRPDARPQSPR
jgi:hypothetical protein